MKYSLLHTEDGSNPGDNLLTTNAKVIINNVLKKIIPNENHECVCSFYSRENFKNCINQINSTDICFISTAIYRYKDVDISYDLIKNIKIPIIALTSTIAVHRYESINNYIFNDKQKEVISITNKYSEIIPTRDIITKFIIENNNIYKVKLVGDLGWFNFGSPIKKMKQPNEIRKILITAGHQKICYKQLEDLLYYLSKKFPQASFTYSTHTLPNQALRLKKAILKKLNIKTIDTSGSCNKIDFYKEFDLHVGYRLHGHIKSLSVGVPSILIAEDSRGLGQGYSLNNIGVFTAYKIHANTRNINILPSYLSKIFAINIIKSFDKKSLEIIFFGLKINKTLSKNYLIKSSKNLINEIDEFINTCIKTKWILYSVIPTSINNYYYNILIPFLEKAIRNTQSNKKYNIDNYSK